ncbi:hypothetical protein SNL152K_2623 [Streptomyces sp. NL15-2K]|nr:hypothetical protein SNL152K_2623 [Streptomyces sp. NL15-2K]
MFDGEFAVLAAVMARLVKLSGAPLRRKIQISSNVLSTLSGRIARSC